MDIKNPLKTKQFKCFRGHRYENIAYMIEAKNEEQANLILIQELEGLGVEKPFEAAQQFVIVEIPKGDE